jgi:hypothetical protein
MEPDPHMYPEEGDQHTCTLATVLDVAQRTLSTGKPMFISAPVAFCSISSKSDSYRERGEGGNANDKQ